jgi:uncharacterized protein
MESKLLADDGERTFALIFDSGDEAKAGLEAFAEQHSLSAARITGIGAFERVTIGYFNWDKKEYEKLTFDEQVEVVSLTGDVALKDAKPVVHAHVALARRDASVIGGHLFEAYVRPTLELLIVESPSYLQKKHDRESGLALISADAG